MISIAAHSPNPTEPYANLSPLLDFLLRNGNIALDGGFIRQPDGWRCRMRDAIDVAAITAEFLLPGSVVVSAKYDTIHDRLSWCGIEGPGAASFYPGNQK